MLKREFIDRVCTLAVPQAHVHQLARELKRAAIEKRNAMDGARRMAWDCYLGQARRSGSCRPFWRCGFAHVLGRLADSGRDYTSVPGYDLVAMEVGSVYSEWEDRCAELWDWLATPYERLPTTAQFLRQAEDMLIDRAAKAARQVAEPEVPF